MLQLYQFPPAMGLPNASPFCLKLETWLRMAEVPYENRYTLALNKAPKGKLPYVRDNGCVLSDSGLIIDHLRRDGHGAALEEWLDARRRAEGLAIRRLIEEHLYWSVLYFRWMTPAGWAVTKPAFFGALKPPLSWLVPLLARRGLREELRGHGMGRHDEMHIEALAEADLDALAALLGDQPYFLGERPSTVDATAYGFLANLYFVPIELPITQYARRHDNLVRYCQRMRERYWA